MTTLRRWRHLLIFAVYFSVALLITFPAVTQATTHFIGSETSDSTEMARNIWWFGYALQHGEPFLYQSLLGYPEGISGTIFMTIPLQYFPAWLLAIVLPLPLAYNLMAWLWMALNGWAMYWLMRYLLNDEAEVPALLAGLIYMAFPLFQGHLHEGHGGLMVAWGAPLYVWALLRLCSAKTQVWRWLLASVIFFYLSTTGHVLQAVYVLLPVTGVWWLVKLWQRDWQAVRRIILMGALASGVLLIIFLPAIRESVSTSAYADTGGYVAFSADLLAVVTPSFFHPLFDSLEYPRRVLGTNLGEGIAYIGIFVGALMLVAVWRVPESRSWALVGAVAWLLSLGPVLKIFNQPIELTIAGYDTLIPLPFAALLELPGFSLARTPGRFNFALALTVAIIAGYGVAWLWRRVPRSTWHYALVLLLAAGILFEYQFFWGMPMQSAALPAEIAALRDDESIEAVFNVPHDNLLAAKDALYLQTAHQQPLIAGQITRQTPVNPAKLEILQTTLDPARLQAAGADVVVHHRQRPAADDPALAQRLATQLGDPFYADERYVLYRVPEAASTGASFALSERQQQGRLTDTAPIAAYLPRDGWYDVTLTLTADSERTVTLHRDNDLLHRWRVTGEQTVVVPIYAEEEQYDTLVLAAEPPCPAQIDPALVCRSVSYVMNISPVITTEQTETAAIIDYMGGIQLDYGQVQQQGDAIYVWLEWSFSEPRTETDVRYVHLVNSEGTVIAQVDEPLSLLGEGRHWTERVRFDESELPSGTYTVRVGWYAYDNATDTVQNYLTLADNTSGAIIGGVSVD